jgi:spore maturation protein CgeB
MRYVIFCQSIASCWNHGNAHFLRGIARELLRRGHQVIVYEPADGWSRTNLARDHGEAALAEGASFLIWRFVSIATRPWMWTRRSTVPM